MKNTSTFSYLKKLFTTIVCYTAVSFTTNAQQVDPAGLVNVFLGTSGDHGQLSPAASYPFGTLSIAPQTYPNLHAGYEYKAKKVLGFTHNRFEGVGCTGSGGNILIKPFVGDEWDKTELLKSTEKAGPGFYQIGFENGISAKMAVYQNSGVEVYGFPTGAKKGFYIDLSHTLSNRFVNEEHQVDGKNISGWVESGTTCNAGIYRVYYYITFESPVTIAQMGTHKLLANVNGNDNNVIVRLGFSSVDVAHAKANVGENTLAKQQEEGTKVWNKVLGAVKVSGEPERERLFYSLLYRTVQSPYMLSETDDTYRATDGSLQKSKQQYYNGWSIWDNYRTQLPLLSLLYPDRYQNITNAIASLYKFGKKDYATNHEPSNTVRTEHAIVVLLDAYKKGFKFDVKAIADSLIAEGNRLEFNRPDKALESSYDAWALGKLMGIAGRKEESLKFMKKAAEYKQYWEKDFKDITRNDVDRMQARGLYQGTIWQYRWFVPFDVKGLINLIGGEDTYLNQLDYFFANDLYNHANEPDLQVPLMYNVTGDAWKSQAMMHKYAADTVVQYYFNDNSRGIDPFVDHIYKNQPDAYVRTMDDDGGAMSAWYVFAACGISPACVGWPIFYLNAPLFKTVEFNFPGGKKFAIRVDNYGADNQYIRSATLNGRPLTRNWLTYEEILKGGTLVLKTSDTPNKVWGIQNRWMTSLDQ